MRCFLNAFCKLCDCKSEIRQLIACEMHIRAQTRDVKPEIRQQVACETHIRAQTRDLTANGPSNEDPMETYKSVLGARNDCLSTPKYVFGGSSSQPAFGSHYSTPQEAQNDDF